MNFVVYLGVLLLLGLISTRVVKRLKLPNVTGFLVVGLIAAILTIIFDSLDIYDMSITSGLTFLNSIVSAIALGFVALSIGEEFKLSKIKALGSKITIITLLQALLAVILVDIALVITCLLLKINLAVAIILGAIAAATAPAATLMVIHQYKAKGELVDMLLSVVAFDDAIGLVVFSISVSIAKLFASGTSISLVSIGLVPLLEIFGSLLVGFLLGVLLHFVIKFFKSRNNHAITTIAFTLLGVGICQMLNRIVINGTNLEFSSLLCCMMIGGTYCNLVKEDEKPIFERDIDFMDHWSSFLFMLFFVLSGTHLATSVYEIIESTTLSALIPVLIIFVIYLITRSTGKYFGAYLGCVVTKRSKTITKYLGITLLPQAGVAIGMANQISNMSEFNTNNLGNIIVTVVLGATLVYELIGPLLTKMALYKAGEIKEENL